MCWTLLQGHLEDTSHLKNAHPANIKMSKAVFASQSEFVIVGYGEFPDAIDPGEVIECPGWIGKIGAIQIREI